MPTKRLAVDSSHNNNGHYLYDANGVDELMREEYRTVLTYGNYYNKLNDTNPYTYKYLGGVIEKDNDTMLEKFYVLADVYSKISDNISNTYCNSNYSSFLGLKTKTYKKKSLNNPVNWTSAKRPNRNGTKHKFNVIEGYYEKTTIDEKFHAIDQALKDYYYTNTDIIDNDVYPQVYKPKEEYTFNVIEDYYKKTTIDEKFHAIDQALNDLYYKKTNKPPGQKYKFNVMTDYTNHNTIDAKFSALNKCLTNLIEEDINGNNDISAQQTVDINNNKETLTNQKERIEKNTSAIMWTISELEKVIVNNKKEISSNTEIVRPFDELITKIFNILAAQANEEISLNTEVIEDNNELLKDNNELLKDNNESLNKTDKNNEAQADNNALYVMLTALTAPFIGLSLYYSSDTEENIDNEIEVF